MSLPIAAAVQFDMLWEDKAANYRLAADMVRAAELPKGSLVTLPEMFSTGFSMNTAATQEPAGGPTSQFLAGLARDHGLYVIGGATQIGADGKPHNEALAFDPTGKQIARYAKMHPFAFGQEDRHYPAGNDVVTFDWQGVRVTPFICYDLRFPELFRKAARRGTDLFAVIASWPAPRTHHWTSLLMARAIENQAYVVGNNRCGKDPGLSYDGRSQVIDFAGTILADADIRPGIIKASVDAAALSAWRSKLPFLKDMRPDLHPAN
jgi:predicted amidohydrolase